MQQLISAEIQIGHILSLVRASQCMANYAIANTYHMALEFLCSYNMMRNVRYWVNISKERMKSKKICKNADAVSQTGSLVTFSGNFSWMWWEARLSFWHVSALCCPENRLANGIRTW